MTNPYLQYYTTQAGSGLSGFAGARIQRGNGFFGNIWSSTLKPLFRYLAKTALSTGTNVVKDVMAGKDLGATLSNNLSATSHKVLDDAISKISGQRGSGKRRRIKPKGEKKNLLKNSRKRKRTSRSRSVSRKRSKKTHHY
jgi:hypothetical protein